jgi:hypothetical protein
VIDLACPLSILLRQVGDRPRLPALDPAPPAVCTHERPD